MTDRMIYMDHAATTPVREEVVEEMLPLLRMPYGNPSSLHEAGQNARISMENARRRLAAVLHAKKQEIFFTSGGTEGDNWAILSAARMNRNRGDHLITSAAEHPAVLQCFRQLEKEGFRVTYLSLDRRGSIRVDDLRNALDDKTTLVSLMTANNETGVIFPVEEAGALCREKGILFHTDAVQAFGKIPLDIEKMPCDLLSVSAHKFYGPKGIGFLYVREGVNLPPWNLGGGQERGLRSGTENVPAIAGMARAAELAAEEMDKTAEKLTLLQKRIESYLLKNVPGTHLNTNASGRIPGLINMRFDGVSGESLMMLLDMKGIMISTASACSQGSVKPSHVLKAMGLTDEEAVSSIRISLGRENTEEEADILVKALEENVCKLRKMKE